MDDDQYPKCHAHTDEDEPLFGARVLWIGKQYCVFIGEGGLGLIEADAVLGDVGPGFRRIPREAKIGHSPMYIQCTSAASM